MLYWIFHFFFSLHFVSIGFVSLRLVSFRFVWFRFVFCVTFRSVSICFFSFRFVLFRSVSFRFYFVSPFTGTRADHRIIEISLTDLHLTSWSLCPVFSRCFSVAVMKKRRSYTVNKKHLLLGYVTYCLISNILGKRTDIWIWILFSL